ncbi:catalase family peroxidase [Methylobacterium sp. Leaf466]|uniref:catalase family peroxidase n=1 Tax=Methylobacterium sp. Leaf466 TaxID=1736386 RepID=UPI0006F6A7D4|nr:catalase family peroxidase [Methylobacterium sp. Leaf466]KQT77969.1 catalase [Methylobacterium sp. Leaf466]
MVATRLRRPLGLAALLAVGFAPLAAAAEGTTAERTITVMNTLWGSHAGLRANHAKGVVVEGSFTATPEAAPLSKASVFGGKPVPVTVRFSNATGLPAIADGAKPANPHGMALKFALPDGEFDIVANSLPFFPVATGEEFLALLTANAQTKPDTPKPTPLEQFVAAHPMVPKAGAGVKTPSSLARETYNGIDAFVFVNAEGKRQPFRFRIVPVAGNDHLSAEEAGKQPPNFLMEGLPATLAKGPVAFTIQAQLANPGDQTKDPTQVWPEDRRLVTMGTLTLSKAAADTAAAEKPLLFLPTNLVDGIEVSDDPLIDARTQAYAVSFGKRSQ